MQWEVLSYVVVVDAVGGVQSAGAGELPEDPGPGGGGVRGAGEGQVPPAEAPDGSAPQTPQQRLLRGRQTTTCVCIADCVYQTHWSV